MIGQGMERLIMLNIVKLTIMVLDIPFTITMDMKKTKNIIRFFAEDNNAGASPDSKGRLKFISLN